MLALLLTACLTEPPDTTTTTDDTGGTTSLRTCADVQADFIAETAAIRSCEDRSECGQVLTGTSCGCTRDWVARTDADTTTFQALIDEAYGTGDTCDLGLTSTCDCPDAYGFDCVDGTCTWDYVTRWTPYPDCATEAGAPFTVESVTLSGDTALVGVAYGGGCEPHRFTTCWPDGAFMESEPVQAALELFHEDNDDPCDAWLTEEVTVDLVPLKEAWQAAYGAASGTILVHLGGESLTYSF